MLTVTNSNYKKEKKKKRDLNPIHKSQTASFLAKCVNMAPEIQLTR